MVTRRQAKKRNSKKPPLSSRISPELQEAISQQVEDLVTFAQNPDTPSVVDPRAVSAPPQVTVRRDEAEVAEERQEEQQLSRADKKFLEAVQKLTKSMDLANSLEKKKGVGAFIKDKIKSVKDVFSVEGVAGLAGFKRDDGSLIGSILESLGQRKDKKKEATDFARKYSKYSEQGRKLEKESAGSGALEGRKVFEQVERYRKIVERYESQEKEAKEFGGTFSKQKTLDSARARIKELTTFDEPKKPTVPTPVTEPTVVDAPTRVAEPASPAIPALSRETLLPEVAAGMRQEIAEASPEEREALRNADPEFLRGVFQGALEEVVNLSEDQLKELEKISTALHVSEEDRLESQHGIPQAVVERREEKEQDENGSILSKMMNIFSKGFGSLKSVLGGLLGGIPGVGTALRMGSAVLSGGAKLAAGAGRAIATGIGNVAAGASKAVGSTVAAGSKLASAAGSAIASGANMAAGAGRAIATTVPNAVAGASKAVGSTVAAGSKLASGAGSAIAAGASKALPLAKSVLGKLGPLAMAGMAVYDGVSGFNKASENLGIEGREATTGEKFSSAAGSIASGLTFGLLDEKSASKGISEFFGAGPEKTVPKREVMNQEMKMKNASLEASQVKQATSSVVNNSPTTIINNNSTSEKTGNRVPVRNVDPTYNRRLDSIYSLT